MRNRRLRGEADKVEAQGRGPGVVDPGAGGLGRAPLGQVGRGVGVEGLQGDEPRPGGRLGGRCRQAGSDLRR